MVAENVFRLEKRGSESNIVMVAAVLGDLKLKLLVYYLILTPIML